LKEQETIGGPFFARNIDRDGGAEPYKKSRYCSSRRKKAKGQTKTKMGGRHDG
jgi:hypothetical protein